MLTSDYDLFVFDWDGTLSKSTRIVMLSRFLMRRYRIKDIERRTKEYQIDAMEKVKAMENESKFYSALYDIYSTITRPRIKEGTIDVLQILRKKKKKIAVFSDSNSYRLSQETGRYDIAKYTDIILSSQSIGHHKPSPLGLNMIRERLDVPRERCIYIGDMAADIYTARFAGYKSCVLADGADSYSLLKSFKPDYIFKDINLFLEALKSKGKKI